MFKFFKKKAKPETKQEVYFVRLYRRYRPKPKQQFVEECEFKAFSSKEKAVSFVEGKGLTFAKDNFGGGSWVKIIKEDMEGHQAFIDKLEIN